jgi:DHA1 family multidrug resistance protein-like MFS transporter
MQPWQRSFRAIWVAEFLAIAGFATTIPIVPLYFRQLGMTDPTALNFWTGMTHVGPSLAMALFAPIWGSLADSYGRKLMLLRAMFGGAILIALQGFTTEPWQVMVLRTLQGCVTGTVAAANVLTASLVPVAQAGYYLGLMHMAVYLGNSTGPLFGGIVGDALGYRFNFFATGLILAAAGLVILRFVREDFSPRPRTGSILRNALPDLSILRRTPALLPLMGVVFSVQMAGSITGPLMPLFVMELMGNGGAVGSTSGFIIASASISAALAAALIGRVSIELGYARTLLICLSGAFLFYLPQGFVTAPWQLLLLRMGSGIFLGGTIPTVNALIVTHCQKDRQGATFGLSSAISSAGMALGPAIGSTIAIALGYRAVFMATTLVLAMVGASIGLGLSRRASSRRAEADCEDFGSDAASRESAGSAEIKQESGES